MAAESITSKRFTQFTPLGIVAAFVGLTEVVVGVALTQVSGGIQVILTVFVMLFPLLVAIAFFLILWYRAYVFYPPSEYGNINPKDFMGAIRDAPMVATQVELARSVGQDPFNEDARFSLIDAMADDVECQCVILMFETGRDLPRNLRYVYRQRDGGGGTGTVGGFGGKDRLQGTGLVRPAGGGTVLSLTDEGRRFAEWLLKKERKCYFFWTPTGGWGTPDPGSPEEKWIADIQTTAQQTTGVNAPKAV